MIIMIHLNILDNIKLHISYIKCLRCSSWLQLYQINTKVEVKRWKSSQLTLYMWTGLHISVNVNLQHVTPINGIYYIYIILQTVFISEPQVGKKNTIKLTLAHRKKVLLYIHIYTYYFKWGDINIHNTVADSLSSELIASLVLITLEVMGLILSVRIGCSYCSCCHACGGDIKVNCSFHFLCVHAQTVVWTCVCSRSFIHLFIPICTAAAAGALFRSDLHS